MSPLYRNPVRRGGETGAVAIIFALSLLVLIGFMGLALDVGNLYYQRRVMQTAADAGALAGASEIYRGRTNAGDPIVQAAALAGTAANEFADDTDGINVVVNQPPASGFYAGNSRYVEAIITRTSPTFFMRVLGRDSAGINARAVAGLIDNTQHCIYALDPAHASVHIQSSAAINADCGIYVNSNDACALDVDSQGGVTASSISITGGYCRDSGASVAPAPDTGAAPVPDPLSYLQPPAPGARQSTSRLVIASNTTLSPGEYVGGILVQSGVTVTLQPGVYVLQGGGLTVDGNIVGDGVMFYNSVGSDYEPILINNPANVDLAAATAGDYANILFFQDRATSSDWNVNHGYGDGFILESDASTVFEGMLYFPTQSVRVKNHGTPRFNNLLVAMSIVVESQSVLNMDFAGLTAGGSPIRRISLVE